jgi:hypothetical protein
LCLPSNLHRKATPTPAHLARGRRQAVARCSHTIRAKHTLAGHQCATAAACLAAPSCREEALVCCSCTLFGSKQPFAAWLAFFCVMTTLEPADWARHSSWLRGVGSVGRGGEGARQAGCIVTDARRCQACVHTSALGGLQGSRSNKQQLQKSSSGTCRR